ncbi:hypothetical protein MYXO_02189 [Myxococcaceae bacterium]|jgi:hypothetical protein|nr:hypothetical protein MYXO_02189 [Myxococcaceae bacterium]
MAASRALAKLVWLAFAGGSLGCNPVSLGPVIFPSEARLGAPACSPCKGATVALAVDANYAPLSDDQEDHGAWSESVAGTVASNVTLQLEDPGGAWTVPLAVRGVFSSRTNSGSQVAAGFPGAELSVAVFDLPNETQIPVALTYPAAVRVRASISGSPVLPRVATLTLLGAGASPATLWPEPGSDLVSRPAVRLRPLKGEGGFAAGAAAPRIGGLEFEIEYPPTLGSPSAFPATEAAFATALVGPGSVSGRARVVIVDPKGFQLDDPGNADRAGEGPLVDIVFGTKTGAFASSQFKIWNLFVTDVNGNVVLDRRSPPLGPDSTSAFVVTAVRNQ